MKPRNQFDCRLAQRYWDIPTNIPRATPLNTPIGTHYCDQLGFMCHPQKYPNKLYGGSYPHVGVESNLLNLDYYNVYDNTCNLEQKMDPRLVQQHFQNIGCLPTPQLWRNHSKLHKYNMPF